MPKKLSIGRWRDSSTSTRRTDKMQPSSRPHWLSLFLSIAAVIIALCAAVLAFYTLKFNTRAIRFSQRAFIEAESNVGNSYVWRAESNHVGKVTFSGVVLKIRNVGNTQARITAMTLGVVGSDNKDKSPPQSCNQETYERWIGPRDDFSVDCGRISFDLDPDQAEKKATLDVKVDYSDAFADTWIAENKCTWNLVRLKDKVKFSDGYCANYELLGKRGSWWQTWWHSFIH